jgi:hypothetical protein
LTRDHERLPNDVTYDEDLSLPDEEIDSTYDELSKDEPGTDQQAGGNRSSGWGRNRKRRRNWRDGK